MAKKQAKAKKKAVKAAKKIKAKATVKTKKAVKTKPAKKRSPKKKGEDLMCFLTTACVNYYGLPDNCSELMTLRKYRDAYLKRTEAGSRLVREYYGVAPLIVEQIVADKKRSATYRYIYGEIKLACERIMLGKNEAAREVYVNMVEKLRVKYLK